MSTKEDPIKEIKLAILVDGEIIMEEVIEEDTSLDSPISEIFPQDTLFCLYCKDPINDAVEYKIVNDFHYHKECFDLIEEEEIY